MERNFVYRYLCPWCGKGEALSDGNAKVTISLQCPKCGRIYIVDMDNGKTERSSARRRNRRK